MPAREAPHPPHAKRPAREERQTFLLRLSDTLRAEPSADAIALKALGMLAEHLRADRCYVGLYQLADDLAVFPHQVGNDRIPPMPASARLSDFPDALRVAFDQTLVIDDIAGTPGLSNTDKQNLMALGMQALVAATLRKGENNPYWSIVTVSARPRRWTPDEVALIEEVTERTWATMERASAEAALRASEERYRTLFDSIDEGFCVFEMIYDDQGRPYDYRFLEVNPAFERHTGLMAPVGKTIREMVPNHEPKWFALYGLVAETGTPTRLEDWAEGLGRWFDIYTFRIGAPDSRRVAALFSDVTERRRAETERAADLDALTRMHALSGRLVEAAGYENLLQEAMDTAAAIVQADKGTLQLLEGDTLRIVAHHGHAQPFLDHFDADRVASACGETARLGERVVVPDVEQSPLFAGTPSLPVLRAAGVRAMQSTPMLTRAGRLVGVVTTHWRAPHTPDEHALWRLDLLARQTADLIEQKQAETRLIEANLRLAEADRRKNEFMAMLSHELRNPLAPIANSLYILDNAQPGGEQADRAKKVIGRQVAQLSSLVNDLLDVTRITRNKVQLQKERLELNEVVRRAVEDNRSLFERGGVALEFAPSPRPALVTADRTRLAQIVGNLLQNAAKFTTRGGHTRVSVDVEDAEAVVRVTDDGVGLARETLASLFQPFMQAEQTLDRSTGGLGLGLALVKGLVELHGGTVKAHSDGLGRGTSMVVRLPLDTGAAYPAANAGASAPRNVRRRVLIIEDNADAADTLSEALAFGDHEVRVAYNGLEGLAQARTFRPDVVLCDIGLPGMNGYEVARAFRADVALRGVFLVALSGYALPEDVQRAAEAGFDRHLAKPPSLKKLEEVLEERLRS